MPIQILYSVENLQELFQIDIKHLKQLTRLGLLPKVEGTSPIRYDKKVIDQWVADGNLEKHRSVTGMRGKGIWEMPKE